MLRFIENFTVQIIPDFALKGEKRRNDLPANVMKRPGWYTIQ